MQRRLPVYGKNIVALIALSLITFATVNPQLARGIDSLLDTIEIQRSSTLDANIEPQDLDLQAQILEIVTSGPIARIVKPAEGPLLRPSAKSGLTAKKESKAKISPFTKWVAPKTSSEDFEPDTSEPDITVTDEAEPELTEPLLARRARPLRSAPRSVPKPIEVAPQPPTPRRRVAKATEPPKTPAKPLPVQPKKTSAPNVEFPINPPQTTRTDLPPLTKSQQQLRTKIRRVLTHYYNRPLNTRDRSPWEMMHAMLAFEVHSKVLQGGPKGEPITAVGWLCFNQACRKRTLMYIKNDGQLQVRVGPALQGHRGQLLAMLAQSKVKREYPMRIDKQDFTVNDLIEMEKRTCYPRTELTFKLIALSHYLEENATWMNDQGMQWNIPKLISEELRQPVRGAACGGTHRLSGLTLAYKNRVKRGESVDGQYLKAKQFVSRYKQYAYKLQNRDGSFSTEWFRGPGNEQSIDRKLKTTGHLLEWLLYAASEKELRHWKTARAANYLSSIMYNNRHKDWEAGPLGHAVHALLLYDRLVFGPYDQQGQLPVAGKTKGSQTNKKR